LEEPQDPHANVKAVKAANSVLESEASTDGGNSALSSGQGQEDTRDEVSKKRKHTSSSSSSASASTASAPSTAAALDVATSSSELPEDTVDERSQKRNRTASSSSISAAPASQPAADVVMGGASDAPPALSDELHEAQEAPIARLGWFRSILARFGMSA